MTSSVAIGILTINAQRFLRKVLAKSFPPSISGAAMVIFLIAAKKVEVKSKVNM